MDSYIAKIKNDAESLIKTIFPAKALELDSAINSNEFSTSEINNIFDINDLPRPEDFLYATGGGSNSGLENSNLNQADKQKENYDETNQIQSSSKKRKFEHVNKSDAADISGCKIILFPNGVIPCNQKIVHLISIIKPYIIHFLDSSAVIKLWIQILIPKVEDFKAELSLQIQEDSLAEIRAVEAEVATYLDHIYKYHTVRGKFISKIAKYPHVADFKQSVLELDEKFFMTIRLVALELRNHYTTVHDILTKNLEKIKKPRSNNDISMY